jgi:hypothetical protein
MSSNDPTPGFYRVLSDNMLSETDGFPLPSPLFEEARVFSGNLDLLLINIAAIKRHCRPLGQQKNNQQS